MKTRIWEDTAAMNIVSVLGFIMNDDGEVVGPERTQVLCKLMPSIHTPAHRAILAMLITGLNDADTQIFYAENGLKVLNEWLLEGIRKKNSGTTIEKKRIEMFSQVRALLRVLDVNVQSDATRRQNAYLCETLPKVVDLLDNAGPDFAAEWSRLNIYRRHFESTSGIPSTVKDWQQDAIYTNGGSSNVTKMTKFPSSPKSSNNTTKTPPASSTPTAASSSAASSNTNNNSSSVRTSSTTSTSNNRVSPSSLLAYQPKSFLLQKDSGSNTEEDMEEYNEDDDEEMLMEEHVVTNVNQTTLNASLEQKIKSLGHTMQYGERMHCRGCRRMTSKRCDNCALCSKCAQKDRCNPSIIPPSTAQRPPSSLSVSDRNVQVLGSAMDQAIYKAFKQEDFHAAFSLISNGMDVNFQRVESDKSSVLMAAAHHGREDAVNKLMSLGANPCLKDSSGDMASAFAKRRGYKALMEKLQKYEKEWTQAHPPST